MAEVLKLSQLAQADGVSQVDVRCAGVEPHFESQRTAFVQSFDEFVLRDYAGHSPPQDSVPLFIGKCHFESLMSVSP